MLLYMLLYTYICVIALFNTRANVCRLFIYTRLIVRTYEIINKLRSRDRRFSIVTRRTYREERLLQHGTVADVAQTKP